MVGRSAELQCLIEALEGIGTGTACLVFIEGEPGIGKSALLQEGLARARTLKLGVFSGRAEELEQDRPFRSISHALGCTRQGGDERRDAIAKLLDAGSGDGVFYRLIDAIEDLVEAETLKRPTLLTIDDLQWADAGTVRALGSIFRRMEAFPLAIVATLRHAPRSEDLTALLRTTSPHAIRIALGPLDQAATFDIVRARLGSEPGPRLRAHIEGAGGNPFYILELLDALAADFAINADGAGVEIQRLTLPPSLVLTLLHRLSSLPREVLEILRSAAVLGASFRIEDLATAGGVGHGEALAAVTSLRSHSVFTDDGENLRFRHDLIREAVYADLGEPVRVSMHRRIGYALANAGASRLEVAGHLMRGSRPGDTEAAEWMIEASSDPTLELRSSMALIERALEIHPEHPQRVSLIVSLAWHLIWMAKPADAIPRLERLLSEVSGVPDRLDVTATLMLACSTAGRDREMKSWAVQVSQLAQQTEEPGKRMVAFHRGYALDAQGDLDGALELTESAAELAHDAEYAAALHERASGLLLLLGRADEALAHSERALSLPASALAKSGHWSVHAMALGDLDRIDEAEAALSAGRSVAEKVGLPMVVAKIVMESAHLRYSLGRWDEALIDAETSASISDEFEFSYGGPDPACIMSWIAYHRKDDSEFARIEAAYPTLVVGNPLLRATLRAVEAFDRGDLGVAGECARALLHRIESAPAGNRNFGALPLLARITLISGDGASARLVRKTAVELAERSEAPAVVLAAARCCALVDRDVAAAKRAVELARSSPRTLLAAGAFEDAAAVLERDEAVTVLTEALHLYEQMGAIRDHARVDARLQELGERAATAPAPARALSGWEALTPAEIEVVRLAAEGLTNREIGSRLFVSHRTVATHLSHVFDKLSLRSRVDLAREAAKRFDG